MELTLHGQRLCLLPQRAIFWPIQRTLLVADLHLGKAATFAAAGVPVPAGSMSADLARLSGVIASTRAGRVIVLGDLLHARHAHQPSVGDALSQWRERHADTEIVLIRGNHDRSAGDPPAALRLNVVDGPWLCEPFVLVHEPIEEHERGYVLAGHVHPGVSLRSAWGGRARAACFVIGRRRGVLPAFGGFTGMGRVPVREGDRIIAVGAVGEDLVELNAASAGV
ncbi:MAG: ligase-associated DNA damage response endonuclease PdeM [Phycisphaerales bacterium]